MSRVPRQPLPGVVTHLLSQALGRHVMPGHLWSGVVGSADWVPADQGMRVSRDLQGTKSLLNNWLASGGLMFEADRRNFMTVSGVALTTPAWQYLDHLKNVPPTGMFDEILGSSRFSAAKVSPALLEYFWTLIGAFRRMDDLEGGRPENLNQVGVALHQIAGYLKSGTFSVKGAAKELMSVFAQVAQIGGWMAFDAGRHGLAQRYFLAGLQAAQNIGDADLGSHILACMSYHAVERNQLQEGNELADAAVRAARATHPLVRTIVTTRVAHARAASGDLHEFESATDEAAGLLEQSRQMGGGPEYLYWFDSALANAVQGQALVMYTLQASRGNAALIGRAESLLERSIAEQAAAPRDAMLFGAWLARAHAKRGDLHRGLDLAATALRRAPSVASQRSRKVLFDLDKDLANLRSDRNLPEVRELRKQLRPALAA
ncbi:MAG: hypothetical protein DLM55_11310 [Acidimicrobiales bacterium]|nr:MAG: hypothetical protein DLM55_11310 [Acidimicrobiales bacterium]